MMNRGFLSPLSKTKWGESKRKLSKREKLRRLRGLDGRISYDQAALFQSAHLKISESHHFSKEECPPLVPLPLSTTKSSNTKWPVTKIYNSSTNPLTSNHHQSQNQKMMKTILKKTASTNSSNKCQEPTSMITSTWQVNWGEEPHWNQKIQSRKAIVQPIFKASVPL